MTFVSYAQNFEDVMLRRALADVQPGFYIDVGAHDPVDDSVTKSFYDAGWRGINIEPVEQRIEALRRDRPEDLNLQVVAGDTPGVVRFYEVIGTGLSTTDEETARRYEQEGTHEIRELTVASRPLTDICREHEVGDIHFLKIDVEGSEHAVLAGLDLTVFRPWVIVVESTLPRTQTDNSDAWAPLVEAHEYEEVWFDGLNRFYLAAEHSTLKAAFAAPPNFWDDFETARERRATELEAECAELHRRLTRAQHHVEDHLRRWEADVAKLQASLQGAQASREAWEKRAFDAEAELQVLMQSYSWRTTAPLRRAGSLVRRLAHRPKEA